MRIKIASGKVYEGTPEELLRRLHQTSGAYQKDSFRAYLDGFVQRLRPVRVYLEIPPAVKTSDDEFARWLGAEMLRVKRWSETTDATEEEKAEKAARAAAEAKAKATAAAAAKPAAQAPAPPAGEKPAG